jgi:hypothetical protein
MKEEVSTDLQWLKNLNVSKKKISNLTLDFETMKLYLSSSLWSMFMDHHEAQSHISCPTYLLKFSKQQYQFKKFINYLLENVVCSPLVFLTALYYIDELSWTNGDFLQEIQSFKLYYSVLLLISSKMHEDSKFENSAFFKMGNLEKEGFTLKEFNQTEILVLNLLDFNLYIPYEDFLLFLESFNFKLKLRQKVLERKCPIGSRFTGISSE